MVSDLHFMLTSQVAYSKEPVSPLSTSLVAKSDLTISATPPPLLFSLLCINILYGSLLAGVECSHLSVDGLSFSQVSVIASRSNE